MADDYISNLFDEVRPSGPGSTLAYGSAAALTTVDDRLEIDFDVFRWGMKVRLKALSLDQEDKIEIESLVKHPKTGEWYQPSALKTALTLREGITVPTLDNAQAMALRGRNPRVAEVIARWIRILSALTHEDIEKHINDTATLDGAPASVDAPGAGDPVLGADDRGA